MPDDIPRGLRGQAIPLAARVFAVVDEATDNLVDLINAANDSGRDEVLEVVGERFERRLSEEIRGMEVRLIERIALVEVGLNERLAQTEARLDKRITDEIAGLRVEMAGLRVEMSHNRSDLIRWMFAFWIGQVAVVVALFTLLR